MGWFIKSFRASLMAGFVKMKKMCRKMYGCPAFLVFDAALKTAEGDKPFLCR